jgi:hypothetical protein
MPISLRLPLHVEAQIASYGVRQGISKSAVIVKSIQEFLAKHAQPTPQQIYDEAMSGMLAQSQESQATTAIQDAAFEAAESRPHKLQVRDALRRKHAERSARAAQALVAAHPMPAEPA